MAGPIYPKTYSNSEIHSSGHYVCPLCKEQATSDTDDIGWVRCPMIFDKPIGLACCTDFQGVALSKYFETHSLRELFDDAANITGQEVAVLRTICLEHQEEVAKEKLKAVVEALGNPELKQHLAENYSQLIAEIESIKKNL